MKKLLLALLLLLPLQANASELEMRGFAALPVVEDGRIKPLSSFARNMLVRFSGENELGNESATSWLARTLFDPARAAQDPVFKVANPHLRAMFALPERAGQTYTLAELAPGLEKTANDAASLLERDAKSLNPDEQALLTLHTNVLLYNQLLQSFSLLLPLPFVPTEVQHKLGTPTPSYLDAQKIEPELAEQLRAILNEETIAAPDRLNPAERDLALFMQSLQHLRTGGANNQLLHIIPTGGNTPDWYAPWQLFLQGQASPATRDLLAAWQQMLTAYRMGDSANWASAVQNATDSAFNNQGDSLLKQRLWLETVYRGLHLYDVAAGLLLLAMAFALRSAKRKTPATTSWWLGATAVLVLAVAMGLRIFILDRPPVGTLYESVLYVALITLLGLLLVCRARKTAAVLLAGQLSTLLLLMAAPGLQAESENMTMLSAVLNTNFWLTVHVLCITAGYGACALTAALAHVQLITHGTVHDQQSRLPLLHRCSLAALLLTAVGTLLGGVWADQSWGRFWGWDPKENGALIIVLWLLWLQHGRMAGQIGNLAFSAGMAALGVVVAQAWFGVNLLSTGLHSYGFIEGIALALFSYTAINLLLIAILWTLAHKRTQRAA